MKKRNILFVVLCFVATAGTTIATSKKNDSSQILIKVSKFGAASNCPGATVVNQSIDVTSDGIIADPQNIDFTDMGLPTAAVVIGEASVSGEANGVVRECTYSADTSNGMLHIYSCADNGVPVCQVSFTPL